MAAFWSVAFDNAPVGIVIAEARRHVVDYANLAFSRFVGVPPGQLLGRGIDEALPASIARHLVPLVEETYARQAPRASATAQQPVPWRAVAWPLDEGEGVNPHVVIQVTLAPSDAVPQVQYDAALDEIRAINSQLVLSNMRAQELLEEAETASHAKDNFLAMLGHELRNPLAPIRNSVEILRHAELHDPKMTEARETIARQTSHLVRLVDDLLEVSRLAHGKISLQTEQFDAVEAVRALVEDYRSSIEGARLSVAVDLPSAPLWIVADRTRISQIIGNVLHNAIKFTKPGGELRLLVTADGGVVRIVVGDSGVGMEPNMLREAFDLFRQADNSLSRGSGGLGVGLSLAKALVKLHGGEIRAVSQGLGKGSEFTIFLPLAAVPDTAIPCVAAPQPAVTGKRVLVVEDNVDAAESLRALLQLKGHSVDVAHSGREALAAAHRCPPDVVLCDIGLPGDMDGYAVARALRSDPVLPRPRMIATTGYGQDQDVQLARAAGFDQHLTKPIDPEQLYEMLSNLQR